MIYNAANVRTAFSETCRDCTAARRNYSELEAALAENQLLKNEIRQLKDKLKRKEQANTQVLKKAGFTGWLNDQQLSVPRSLTKGTHTGKGTILPYPLNAYDF